MDFCLGAGIRSSGCRKRNQRGALLGLEGPASSLLGATDLEGRAGSWPRAMFGGKESSQQAAGRLWFVKSTQTEITSAEQKGAREWGRTEPALSGFFLLRECVHFYPVVNT